MVGLSENGPKNKSSEVVWDPFLSASSSLLTLARPAFVAFPCGAQRAIFAWAPGSPPTGQTYPTPRNSILPSTFLPCSPRPALCYRPLPALFPNLAIRKVTSARAPDAAPTGKTSRSCQRTITVLLFLRFQSTKNTRS